MGATERQVAVTGLGLICPLGDDAETVHNALCVGASGLSAISTFDVSDYSFSLGGEVRDFDPAAYLGAKNLRPLDRTGRLAAVAAHLALQDAGWDEEALADREVGLVLGTTFGSLHTIVEFDHRALEAGPQYAKPLDFANSVINAAAGQSAIWYGLRGLNATISGGTASGLDALAFAIDQIRTGRSQAVLAGGADELSLAAYHGFAKNGRLCGSNGHGHAGARVPVPFDRHRGGFALAEGAALLMLEDAAAARARGARILALLTGHGGSFDPSQGRTDDEAAEAVGAAIQAALADAGWQPADLAAVSTSANGSVNGDRHEACGLAAGLGEAVAAMPVTAIKGALGESLGAGGALQAALLIQALDDGRLPGIAGFEAPEDGSPQLSLSPTLQSLDLSHGRRALATATGLDGSVTAVTLEGSLPAAEG